MCAQVCQGVAGSILLPDECVLAAAATTVLSASGHKRLAAVGLTEQLQSRS